METLREVDQRRILDYLARIYEICHFDEFVCRVITSISELIPVDLVTYDEMNLRDMRTAHWCTPRAIGTEDRRLAFQRVVRDHEDPQLEYYSQTGDFRPLRVLDFMSRSKLRRTRFYDECLRTDRFEDLLTIPFSESDGTISGVALARDREFTERERAVLGVLKPHLQLAARNANAATSLMRRERIAAEVADCLGRGFVLLDPSGRIKSLNRSAEMFLASCFSERFKERLPDLLDRWVRQQALWYRGKRPLVEPSAPFQIGVNNGISATIRLLKCGEDTALLIDEDQPDNDPKSLETLGISPRESQVLALVAAGKTNREIGIILSISHKTVEKHLEHVYATLAVETRAAAIAIALRTSDRAFRQVDDRASIGDEILSGWDVARYLPPSHPRVS